MTGFVTVTGLLTRKGVKPGGGTLKDRWADEPRTYTKDHVDSRYRPGAAHC